jgi:hypothetical protein
MSGCRSCSGRSERISCSPNMKVEKLEKGERSDNPRYPHVFEGRQAIYTDDNAQMIVTVLEDRCDEECDSFTLKPQKILKDKLSEHSIEESFEVSQAADECCWKLHALI